MSTQYVGIQAEEFERMTGHAPTNDDLDRVNCQEVGTVGHSQCGVCDSHGKPRFECGCTATRAPAIAPKPAVSFIFNREDLCDYIEVHFPDFAERGLTSALASAFLAHSERPRLGTNWAPFIAAHAEHARRAVLRLFGTKPRILASLRSGQQSGVKP